MKEAYQAFDIKMGKSVLNVMHADCDLLGCYTADFATKSLTTVQAGKCEI